MRRAYNLVRGLSWEWFTIPERMRMFPLDGIAKYCGNRAVYDPAGGWFL